MLKGEKMIWVSVLNLIVAIVLIALVFQNNEIEHKNILFVLFGLNLILIIINILLGN